jgi:hypothetical protein
MIREALEWLAENVNGKVHTVEGRSYSRHELQPLPSPESLAEELEFHSLSGIVDYLASELDVIKTGDGVCTQVDGDGIDDRRVALVVDGPDGVSLVARIAGPFRQRERLAVANPYLSGGFGYGRFMGIDEFVTMAQAHFANDGADLKTLLRVVGNITQESVGTVEDDGVSQQVTARAGIAKVANVVVPNPVTLRPYRTFSEIQQPASQFILRMRRGESGQMPTAALFETGDLRWKHEAVEDISGHLEYLLEAAEIKVPVFA